MKVKIEEDLFLGLMDSVNKEKISPFDFLTLPRQLSSSYSSQNFSKQMFTDSQKDIKMKKNQISDSLTHLKLPEIKETSQEYIEQEFDLIKAYKTHKMNKNISKRVLEFSQKLIEETKSRSQSQLKNTSRDQTIKTSLINQNQQKRIKKKHKSKKQQKIISIDLSYLSNLKSYQTSHKNYQQRINPPMIFNSKKRQSPDLKIVLKNPKKQIAETI